MLVFYLPLAAVVIHLTGRAGIVAMLVGTTCGADTRVCRVDTRVDAWSFYIFSGGGTADELFFRDFDLEFLQKFGVVRHFLA